MEDNNGICGLPLLSRFLSTISLYRNVSICILVQEQAGEMQSGHHGLCTRIPGVFKEDDVTPGRIWRLKGGAEK